AVSCLCINPKSQHLAIGTMEGSVYCFNSRLQPIYTAPQSHKSFVTAVEFLPDYQLETSAKGPPKKLPGPGADAKCTILSLSVDQAIKAHLVPWPRPTPLTQSLAKFAIYSLILYILTYVLLVY
uniref:WD_REPEATS_REGION domain-containing protein n=2 Tax=Bursaphelenchus xylophilus TaxID=6326 RepID=A0A1I7SJR4_BURXY